MSSDRPDSRTNRAQALVTPTWAVFLVVVVIGVYVGVVVWEEAPEMAEDAQEFESRCDEHDGELWNAHAMGEHAGLHCELPNGTQVHMHEVVSDG